MSIQALTFRDPFQGPKAATCFSERITGSASDDDSALALLAIQTMIQIPPGEVKLIPSPETLNSPPKPALSCQPKPSSNRKPSPTPPGHNAPVPKSISNKPSQGAPPSPPLPPAQPATARPLPARLPLPPTPDTQPTAHPRTHPSIWLHPGPPVYTDAALPSAISPLAPDAPRLATLSALASQTRRLLQSCYASDASQPGAPVVAATPDLHCVLTRDAKLPPYLSRAPASPPRSWWLASTPRRRKDGPDSAGTGTSTAATPSSRLWLITRRPAHPIRSHASSHSTLTISARVDVTRLAGSNGAAEGTDDVWLEHAVHAQRAAAAAGDPAARARVRRGALPDPRCVWVAPGLQSALRRVRALYGALLVVREGRAVCAEGGGCAGGGSCGAPAYEVTHASGRPEGGVPETLRRLAAAVEAACAHRLGGLLARRERFFFDARAEAGQARRLACCVPLEDARGRAAMWVCFLLDGLDGLAEELGEE